MPRMLQYRIVDPGPGCRVENLEHAAVGQRDGDVVTHTRIRDEKGICPGGFGLLLARA
ncbi:MAG TPA: hypothetical protein VMU28_07375 [Terriglobales bacterium]|nr:hypothetical protein [Terriglobales bacterium]